MLSPEEVIQYQRHISLPSIGRSGQEKLKSSSVLVIGAGGLGCPVLQYLVSAGIGKIGIVDGDHVEMSNLHRQVIYTHEDIGKPKAKIAADRLKLLNPYIEIQYYVTRISPSNAEGLMKDYDLVVDGTDNFSSRYLINDACVLFGKVLVYGAIYQFEGQVSVFNYKNGPTYRCLYPSPPKFNELPNCSEIGVLGVLPGIIGSFQALEAIKALLNLGDVLSGKVMLFNVLTQRNRLVKLNPTNQNRKISSLEQEKIHCRNDQQQNYMIKELKPPEFSEMINLGKDFLILDVRENWEREISKIMPSIHIPLGDFSASSIPSLLDEFTQGKTIVVYCKAGVRSRMVCELLLDKGYQNLYNLAGGIMEWEKEGFEVS